MSRGRFYEADLAWVHDRGFGDLAEAAGRELATRMKRAGLRGRPVVDLGCGSGLLAARLVAAGSPVLGVDVSPAMIALARRRAPRARFRVASLLDVALPRCGAIAIVGEGLNYLHDRRLAGNELRRFLERCHAALEPDGVLLLDVRVVPPRRMSPLRRTVLQQGPDWAVAAEIDVDPARQRLTREITAFRRIRRHWRRSHERHAAQLFGAAELAAALRDAGFAVRRLRAYGRLSFAPDHAGFVARRR